MISTPLIILCFFCSVTRRSRSNVLTRNMAPEESMEFDNLAYARTRTLPDSERKLKVKVSAQLVEQPGAGLSSLHIDPGGDCPTLDNVKKRSDNRPQLMHDYVTQ